MSIDWTGFLTVVVLAYVIPGPDFAVIVRAASSSRRAGFAAALGAQCGLCVHMAAAAIGLSLLLVTLPGSLLVVQFAGAAYLVYLGFRTVATAAHASGSRASGHVEGDPADPQALRGWAVKGLLTNLLNPKAVLFFVSLLPQFVDGDAPLPPQVVLLGVVDVAVGIVLWSGLVAAASRLVHLLAAPRARRRWDRATGGVFVGLGVLLAVTHV